MPSLIYVSTVEHSRGEDLTKVNFNSLRQYVATALTDLGLKVLGAIALWIIGRSLIGIVTRVIGRAMTRQRIDATLIRWIQNTTAALLNIALAVAILGYFGVQTTTFAALIAAGGVAIGMAWSGLLSNFAAGVFLVILQPFKVGDFVVVAGGVAGTVHEIGSVCNQYPGLCNIPNVLATPAPDVEILSVTLAGPVLAVRPYCNNQHYWQVYFDTNRLIRESFGEAGCPVPDHYYTVRGAETLRARAAA